MSEKSPENQNLETLPKPDIRSEQKVEELKIEQQRSAELSKDEIAGAENKKIEIQNKYDSIILEEILYEEEERFKDKK